MNRISRKQKLNEVYSDDILLEIDEKTREIIQNSLLEMFLEIQEVCTLNRIRLFLCGGSALGAVRHKGFIPWDDDIDLSMTRSEFNKFKKVFEKELSDRYILNAPNYSKTAKSRFPKIMKKGTIFRELGDESAPENCGLFLDIFIIDNVPDGKINRMFKGVYCNILEFIGSQVASVQSDSEDWRTFQKRMGKINYYIRYIFGKFFSFRTASAWNERIDRAVQHSDNRSKYCTLACGSKHYFGEILKRNEFMPAEPAEFEGHKVYVFHDVHKYLSNLYGTDYMNLPAPEKRQKHFIAELKI